MSSGERRTLRAENPLYDDPLSGENPHSMTLATEEEGKSGERENQEEKEGITN